MSSLYKKSHLHVLTVKAIDTGKCCGPYPKEPDWEPDRKYWICEYHTGYDDGIEAMANAMNEFMAAAYPRQGG